MSSPLLQTLRKASALTIALALCACTGAGAQTNLYRALGGEPSISRITELFILEIDNDARVIHYFEVSNVQRFREKFSEHLCVISDGPCEYTGDTMVDTHVGMHVTEGDFNAIVEDLIAAMNKAGVNLAAQNRLLERLAALRGEIIYL